MPYSHAARAMGPQTKARLVWSPSGDISYSAAIRVVWLVRCGVTGGMVRGTEASEAELERTLLLVLGCAVQCDDREHFIDNIRHGLDVDTQSAIVQAIQQVPPALHSLASMHISSISLTGPTIQ